MEDKDNVKIIKCCNCPKEFEISVYDTNTIMCDDCYKKKREEDKKKNDIKRNPRIEEKVIVCACCHKEFKIKGTDNRTIRCNECQNKHNSLLKIISRYKKMGRNNKAIPTIHGLCVCTDYCEHLLDDGYRIMDVKKINNKYFMKLSLILNETVIDSNEYEVAKMYEYSQAFSLIKKFEQKDVVVTKTSSVYKLI